MEQSFSLKANCNVIFFFILNKYKLIDNSMGDYGGKRKLGEVKKIMEG